MRDELAIAGAMVLAVNAPTAAADLEEAVRPFSERNVLMQHLANLGSPDGRDRE